MRRSFVLFKISQRFALSASAQTTTSSNERKQPKQMSSSSKQQFFIQGDAMGVSKLVMFFAVTIDQAL
jgi:hypothetical protein